MIDNITPHNRYVGKVDVAVIEPGPGAYRPVAYNGRGDWDSADAWLTIGDIADHERQSIAEIAICIEPHSLHTASDVSIELTAGDIDELIRALTTIREAHR